MGVKYVKFTDKQLEQWISNLEGIADPSSNLYQKDRVKYANMAKMLKRQQCLSIKGNGVTK